MINELVSDLIEYSRARIAEHNPAVIAEVRNAGTPLIALSAAMRTRNLALKNFLHEHLYHDYRVHRMTHKAARIITTLFEAYHADSLLLPRTVQQRITAAAASHGQAGQARAVADYIAGMTDRFAIAEYQRLVDPVGAIR
ncbi:MAG: deoxyguanosinetriphosphate triphosphohydrolase, partial [Gammaproteobacteria bacterium]